MRENVDQRRENSRGCRRERKNKKKKRERPGRRVFKFAHRPGNLHFFYSHFPDVSLLFRGNLPFSKTRKTFTMAYAILFRARDCIIFDAENRPTVTPVKINLANARPEISFPSEKFDQRSRKYRIIALSFYEDNFTSQ